MKKQHFAHAANTPSLGLVSHSLSRKMFCSPTIKHCPPIHNNFAWFASFPTDINHFHCKKLRNILLMNKSRNRHHPPQNKMTDERGLYVNVAHSARPIFAVHHALLAYCFAAWMNLTVSLAWSELWNLVSFPLSLRLFVWLFDFHQNCFESLG